MCQASWSSDSDGGDQPLCKYRRFGDFDGVVSSLVPNGHANTVKDGHIRTGSSANIGPFVESPCVSGDRIKENVTEANRQLDLDDEMGQNHESENLYNNQSVCYLCVFILLGAHLALLTREYCGLL